MEEPDEALAAEAESIPTGPVLWETIRQSVEWNEAIAGGGGVFENVERSTDYTPIHDDKCALTRKLVINKRVENGKLQFVKQDGMPMEFKILR